MSHELMYTTTRVEVLTCGNVAALHRDCLMPIWHINVYSHPSMEHHIYMYKYTCRASCGLRSQPHTLKLHDETTSILYMYFTHGPTYMHVFPRMYMPHLTYLNYMHECLSINSLYIPRIIEQPHSRPANSLQSIHGSNLQPSNLLQNNTSHSQVRKHKNIEHIRN